MVGMREPAAIQPIPNARMRSEWQAHLTTPASLTTMEQGSQSSPTYRRTVLVREVLNAVSANRDRSASVQTEMFLVLSAPANSSFGIKSADANLSASISIGLPDRKSLTELW